MKNILLLNAEGVQTVCIARSLRQDGHKVVGFCNHKMSSGYATRWLSKRHKTPDMGLDIDGFSRYLNNYLSQYRVDLIIPLADESAKYLSIHKAELENKYKLKCAVPSYDIFEIANDKQKLMEHCEKYGVCHPRTTALPLVDSHAVPHGSFDNEMKRAAEYVKFPAVIKPNLSQGAKGIVKVDNIKELSERYPEIFNAFGNCALQEYVEQPDYYYNVMLYRDRNGGMDNYTIMKIRRYFPLKGGSSCYCETIEHDYLLNQCREVLTTLDWHGFADFDILEDRSNGELKIIEINPRVPSSLQAAFAAGVDYGKVFVCDEFGKKMPSFDYKAGKEVRWMGLDVMWFLFSKERFSFKPSWFNFFGKNVSYHDFALNDPWPMFAGMFAGIVKYLNPEFRRAKLKG